MTQRQPLDALLIGGGIAGIWTLHRLLAGGYRAALLDAATTGSQTDAAQGIIHGGVKYLLDGRTRSGSEVLAAMPARWRSALGPGGELGLDDAAVTTAPVYLFSTAATSARLAALLASRGLRGRASRTAPADYPAALRHPDFSGAVWTLDDFAVDVAALMGQLRSTLAQHLHVESAQVPRRDERGYWQLGPIRARHLLLTAGAGNADLLARLGIDDVPMQRRPLHQVWMTAPGLSELFAHAVTGLDAEPRLTISTHLRDGQRGWSLGGALASGGMHRDAAAQINHARQELRNLMPWLDLGAARFSTSIIDRAEPALPGGRRIDRAFVAAREQLLVGWPTKLALAPDLADQMFAALQDQRPITQASP